MSLVSSFMKLRAVGFFFIFPAVKQIWIHVNSAALCTVCLTYSDGGASSGLSILSKHTSACKLQDQRANPLISEHQRAAATFNFSVPNVPFGETHSSLFCHTAAWRPPVFHNGTFVWSMCVWGPAIPARV